MGQALFNARRALLPAAIATIALLAGTPARSQEDEEEARASLRAEVEFLKREVGDLRARVRMLERALAEGRGGAASGPTEVTEDLGIVLPGGPRGGTGSESLLKLPVLLHHATVNQKPVEDLTAFGELSFLVPESTWEQVSKGTKTVRGLPTKGELELALKALRKLGPDSSVSGVMPIDDAGGDERAVRAVSVRVQAKDGREALFVVTGVRLSGRWLVAHVHAASEVERTRDLVRDIATSAVTFRVFRTRPPRDLAELARDRDTLEKSENLRRAGLKFPLGEWLDRLEGLGWELNGPEIVSPFYRIRFEDGTVTATPKAASYPDYAARPESPSPGAAIEVLSGGKRINDR